MKMMSNLLISALVMFFATSAYSATYNIGELGEVPYVKPVVVGSGEFTDWFNFSISTESTGAASVSNHTLTFYGIEILDISDLTLEIYSGGMMLGGSYESLSLDGGNYSAKVFGTSTGVNGGTYTFSAIAAPVPEASTLSLMLAGFGLIGFMSYRRRNLI